jgi:hypothetical protein
MFVGEAFLPFFKNFLDGHYWASLHHQHPLVLE